MKAWWMDGRPDVAGSMAHRRDIMLKEHLIGRGIRSQSVIRAMEEVPREGFIPEEMAAQAYDDNPLPIDEGQTISQPYIVAYMTEALELAESDRVLEIGTGSGYAAAVLSRIVTTVHSVERIEGLAKSARKRLGMLGYTNISVHEGDGTLGWPEHAPYDAIVVTAGAPQVPSPLLHQLAIGGRLVIPVGPLPEFQILVRVRRLSEDDYRTEELCGVRFVPLIGAKGW
ncbi:MAG TPA: protein-L-isoaspartate(D-aspartate) O-methyltransferase [Geobacteraceae bacterium]|nr:protein-L-isoaspartate(D-aspartate) O-methyltransferase [Geobacteraceae bacterium]